MATLKQILKAHGFQFKSYSSYREQWRLRQNRKFVGKSYVSLEIHSYERNASQVVVMIGGKKRSIWFGYNDNNSAKAPTAEQLARFEELVIECKAAAINEEANPAPKKPRAPQPPREALTEKEKFDNRIYRWLGDFYVCGFIGKDMRPYLYYHKAGNYIQVADTEMIMVHAFVRQRHLDEANIPFTLAQFEEWLQDQGIKRKAQKRVKFSPPLYD